eukprot:g1651.t1
MANAVKLRTGALMPVMSLGCWKIERAVTKDVVVEAIRAGYRGLDCACDYGNEKEVGEGIQQAIAEGLVTREQLFVTSKLWCTYHKKEHVEPACRKTLADLGLAYVDLYLIHFPISLKYVPIETRYPPEWLSEAGVMEEEPVPVSETWAAMEALADAGLCKAIGVSNFKAQLVTDLMSACRIAPAVNQYECHPYLVQPALSAWMRKHGIVVTGFSPLGSSSYVEIGGDRGHGTGVLQNEVVLGIAAAKGATPAQVVLRWQLQLGHTLVPKSTNAGRLRENLAAGTEGALELTGEEMSAISALDCGARYNDPGEFVKNFGPEWAETGYPIHS